ncbi:MAG TPA: hypothetical protein VIJ61_12155 [Thermoanaerobaculia bacterium]
MKRLWIGALCLTGFLIAGLPLHAQTAPAPATNVPAADAAFLATLQVVPPATGVPAPSWVCTVTQCRDNCICGGGCVSVCTSTTACTCTCRSTHVPPLPCQV